MENAAQRYNKRLSKVYKRAMAMSMATATAPAADSSLCTMVDEDDRPRLEDIEESETEGSDTETERVTEIAKVSAPAAPKPILPKPTHDELDDGTTKPYQRQTKACTGPIPRDILDEGVSLAFSNDDYNDFARIHAANRRAWPRGQEPISAQATVEDKEIAELVRRGLIGAGDLQVDHDHFDDLGEDVLPYTVRFVEAGGRGKKGRKGGRRPQVEEAAKHEWEMESDWWYLDDEAYAQLLSDGGTELLDWSETSSFVCVD